MASNCGECSPPSTVELLDPCANLNTAALDILVKDEAKCAISQIEVIGPSSNREGNTNAQQRACLVCGDEAKGQNFGVVACGSCKAFFRRNALKSQVASCLFTGSCSVTPATRSFCPPCRLNKCRASGMRTDLIMSQEAKEQRKEKIERNRKRKLECRPHLSSQRADCNLDPDNSDGSPTSQMAAGDDCLVLDVRPAVAVRQTPCLNAGEAARTAAEPSVGDGAVEVVVSGRFAALFQRVQTVLATSALRMQRRLVSGDEARLHSLARVYQSTVGLDPSVEAPEPVEGFSMQLFAARISNLLRQIVLFAKETPHFAALPRCTQIRLLKAGAVPCILIRSAELLDLRSGCWMDSCGGDMRSLDDLNQATGSTIPDHFFIEHLALTAGVKQLVPADADGQSDRMALVLMFIIALLSPDHLSRDLNRSEGGTGSDAAVVSDAQQYYTALLRRHLEATYSFQLCASVLPALLKQISVLKRFAKRQRNGFMSCVAVSGDPLCREVLGR